MNRYSINFKYSKDGEHWCGTSRTVEAESDFSAMEIIKSRYPYVEIISVRKIGYVLFIVRSTGSRDAFVYFVIVESIIKSA